MTCNTNRNRGQPYLEHSNIATVPSGPESGRSSRQRHPPNDRPQANQQRGHERMLGTKSSTGDESTQFGRHGDVEPCCRMTYRVHGP